MPGIYIHIPFCRHRCEYCDFITYAGQEIWLPQYVEALKLEMRFLGEKARQQFGQAGSLYFGGGTPSLLTPEQVKELIQTASDCLGLELDAEITLEANPATDRAGYLEALRRAGVNRLSLGVQSFHNEELLQIGRIHSAEQALETINTAQASGFSNISIDLIFGLPGQTLESWATNLEQAFTLGLTHLSLYSLILEEGTPLMRKVKCGQIMLPDEDVTAEMFVLAREKAYEAGWEHYEISNFALSPDFEARHNKTYWQNGAYLGIGAAAHGSSGAARFENTAAIQDYICRMSTGSVNLPFPATPATIRYLPLDEHAQMQETMMLGLRLVREGVSVEAFRQKHGQDMGTVFHKEITQLIRRRLVEWVEMEDGAHLRLTKQGVLVGNQAFMAFV